MTTGNEAHGTSTEQRLVEATLELITEKGGSLDVNLRAVSRRVGCAHTNVYNYFDSYQDLLWEAFRRALRVYGEYLTRDLGGVDDPTEYLRRTVTNLASFPQQDPGLYRLIGSDPIDLEAIPADVMETVTSMKRWFASVVAAAAGPEVSAAGARDIADIVIAYIDGETLNLINGRAIADEDLSARVVGNALRLFGLLAGEAAGRGGPAGAGRALPPDPASIFSAKGDVTS